MNISTLYALSHSDSVLVSVNELLNISRMQSRGVVAETRKITNTKLIGATYLLARLGIYFNLFTSFLLHVSMHKTMGAIMLCDTGFVSFMQ